jgi:hypothetical protein
MSSSQRSAVSWTIAWMAVVLLVAACADKNGGAGSPGKCVDISIGPSDLTCAVDQDCSFAVTGHVCDGDCACGTNAIVNRAAASRVSAALSSLDLSQTCECGFPGYARCIAGQCETCAHQQGACMSPASGDASADQ